MCLLPTNASSFMNTSHNRKTTVTTTGLATALCSHIRTPIQQHGDSENDAFRTLTSSVSIVFQNSWHILGSILSIYCPNSQNIYV